MQGGVAKCFKLQLFDVERVVFFSAKDAYGR